jgi:hypothetical protein
METKEREFARNKMNVLECGYVVGWIVPYLLMSLCFIVGLMVGWICHWLSNKSDYWQEKRRVSKSFRVKDSEGQPAEKIDLSAETNKSFTPQVSKSQSLRGIK